jgi:hypothetical protein
LLLGAIILLCACFQQVGNEKTWKHWRWYVQSATISTSTESSGPPKLGNARGIAPAHRHGHQNGQQRWHILLSLFCLLLPRQPLGQYGASSCPMAASSGIQSSPGHAALGDAHCIAQVHLEGLQNGLQRKYISMSLSIFSSTITVAK